MAAGIHALAWAEYGIQHVLHKILIMQQRPGIGGRATGLSKQTKVSSKNSTLLVCKAGKALQLHGNSCRAL